MKQKKNRRMSKKTKKVLVGVGVGFLALAAVSGLAYGLNTQYKWVELPAWLTVPEKEPLQELHIIVPNEGVGDIEVDFNGPAVALNSVSFPFYKGLEINEDSVKMIFDTTLLVAYAENETFELMIASVVTSNGSYYFEEDSPLFGQYDFTDSEVTGTTETGFVFSEPVYTILY